MRAPQVIRGGRWKAGFAAPGLLAAAAATAAAAGAQDSAAEAALCLVTAAACLAGAMAAVLAFVRPPQLVLTDEGLTHVHPYGAPRRIAWRDIVRIESWAGGPETNSVPVVMYRLRDGVRGQGPLAGLYRRYTGNDGALVGSWPLDAEALVQALEFRRRAGPAGPR